MSFCPGVVRLCTLGVAVGFHWHLVHLHSPMLYCPGAVGLCTSGVDLWWCLGVNQHWVCLYHPMSYCSGVVGICTLSFDLWGQLALGMSAFCNIILSWCSRVLYKWAQFPWGINWHYIAMHSVIGHTSLGAVGFCICELD